MKNEAIYREIFISNTIRLVAQGGFEMATTRAISGDRRQINNIKLNEAHIYRVFGSKEALFAQTFATLDDELLDCVKQGLSSFEKDRDFRSEFEQLFMKLWYFLLQNESKLRYYTRYYHSTYFKNGIYAEHVTKYTPIIQAMTPFFAKGADVWSLLHHVITTMLEFATRIYNGTLDNTPASAMHIFNVAYSSIAAYLIS